MPLRITLQANGIGQDSDSLRYVQGREDSESRKEEEGASEAAGEDMRDEVEQGVAMGSQFAYVTAVKTLSLSTDLVAFLVLCVAVFKIVGGSMIEGLIQVCLRIHIPLRSTFCDGRHPLLHTLYVPNTPRPENETFDR